jgi:hypothetical protein
VTLSDGMWSGQSCLIVGGGPSLRAMPDWARRLAATDLATIAVNRAREFMECPNLWIGVDSVYWRKKAAPKAEDGPPRVWVDHGEKRPGQDKVDIVLPCAAPAGTPNRHAALAWGRSLAEGVGCGGNSGFAALNLADVLGAETVYLLGFDLRGENGKTANFHDGYSEKPASDQVYDRFLESFRWAAKRVRAHVVVLEVQPGDSRLDCFEKRLAGEVL